MRPTRFFAHIVAFAITLLALARPAPVAAADCGAEYLTCVVDLGAPGSTDWLHDDTCYNQYIRCAAVRLLRY